MKQILASEIITSAALTWHDAGCSIIPIRADGTKKPLFEWKQFMANRAVRHEVEDWFIRQPQMGIGIVCGKVSGNLEMLELEGRAATGDHLDKITAAAKLVGVLGTWISLQDSGYAEWTPSGGLHFLYRISDHEVPPNQKVARRPATHEELEVNPKDRFKVLSETRGKGGYTVVAPSGGSVHPSGDSWSCVAGEIGTIPTITWEQRCKLHQAIHDALDEMPQTEAPQPRPAPAETSSGRPGDDFNERADWREILEPHGWRIHHIGNHGTVIYWTRPGKKKIDGHSATTGHSGDADRLYVFSSATEFTPEVPYSKFAVYSLLEHNGDHTAAARALRARGYGASPSDSYHAVPVPATPMAPAGALATTGDTPAAGTLQPATTDQAAIAPWHYTWSPPGTSGAAIVAAEPSYASMGEIFAEAYETGFKHIAKKKAWRYFNGKIWVEDDTLQHQQAGIELLRRARKAALQHKVDEWIKWTGTATRAASPDSLVKWAKSDRRIAARIEDFDTHRHMITLNNGVMDLDTHTFTAAHDPHLMATKQLHITYDKDATSPKWDALLEQLLPDADMRGYLQRAAGHTLLGDSQERALFLLHGDPGSGKSQVVRVLQLLFGDFSEVAQATTFNDQSKKATLTNDLNDLRGKRFVSVAELEEGERLNESLVKRLTGGDTAKSRGLYQENQEWEVQFTLWMMTNFLPRLNSDDAAMWKRVKPIHFPTVIANHGKEIKKYGEKIFAEEAAGILNWLLDGVRAYQEHGLDDLDQITEAVAEYRHNVDNVAQFIHAAVDENLIAADADQAIPARNLHAIYQSWCTSNGIKWLGERRFGQRMESLGYERRKTMSANVWIGLGTGGHGVLGTMPMRR